MMSSGTISRRRLIAISAAAAFVPGGAVAARMPFRRWTGHAMGANTSLTISGLEEGEFARISVAVSDEIDRLESIFSLYREDSDIVRLNADGHLANPPFDLVKLLSLAGSIHRATDGAFDPTIQPLWQAYARSAGAPEPEEVERVRALTGWNNLAYSTSLVSFGKPEMAITLNGIAQGYATDRVAGLLRSHGLHNVLVSVGEIAAIGEREPGQSWRVGISDREDGDAEEVVLLKDRAIATSAPAGMSFDRSGTVGHIINPGEGPTARWQRVSVVNASAAIADGLSTAFCVMNELDIRSVLQQFPATELIAMDSAGKRVTSIS